ncbi:hypothetical protein KCO_13737 [Pectobacterium brasiliense ICMP 19477]|nr:hypothetical protein KCO_13737 [Pectobacterium brasiliense ICMP 19477]
MHLRFSESETAFDYMMATREYIEQHEQLRAINPVLADPSLFVASSKR